MVIHQNITVEFDGIDINGLVEESQKTITICIVPKYVLLFVAAAGHVVNSVRVLYAKGSRHAEEYGMS